MHSHPEPLLVCEHVDHTYLERFAALRDVSLTVNAGEKLALLGANGCGKSTLLKLLDGLVVAENGTYRAFGHAVTEEHLEDEQFSRGFRSRIGFVFQNSEAQVFSPTVREEIAFGPLQMGLGVDAVQRRIDDLLAMLDIEEIADRPPYQLSGGQKKRVAIASVLATNPEVLLFDEPTAGLDPRTQQWLLELMTDLNASGKTIVCATHDLHVLEFVADRAIVFSEDHRIVADGTPTDILADRDTLLAANIVHAHWHHHDTIRHTHPHGLGHHPAEAGAPTDEDDTGEHPHRAAAPIGV